MRPKKNDYLTRKILRGGATFFANLASNNELDQATRDKAKESFREIVLNSISQRPKLAIVGEFSAGKSTLINALIGMNILASDFEPTTSVATHVRWGPAFQITVEEETSSYKFWKETDCSKEQIKRFLFENSLQDSFPRVLDSSGNLLPSARKKASEFIRSKTVEASGTQNIQRVLLEIPSESLDTTVDIVDTPGFNPGLSDSGDSERHARVTEEAISQSHLALFVLDARNCLKNTEKNFFEKYSKFFSKTFFVVNKMDLLDEDEREDIEDYVKESLAEAFSQDPDKVAIYFVCSCKPESDELMPYWENLSHLRHTVMDCMYEFRDSILLDKTSKLLDSQAQIVAKELDLKLSENQSKLKELNAHQIADPNATTKNLLEKANESYRNKALEWLDKIDPEINVIFENAINAFRNSLHMASSNQQIAELAAKNAYSVATSNFSIPIKNLLNNVLSKCFLASMTTMQNEFEKIYNEIPELPLVEIKLEPIQQIISETINQNLSENFNQTIDSLRVSNSDMPAKAAYAGFIIGGPLGALAGGIFAGIAKLMEPSKHELIETATSSFRETLDSARQDISFLAYNCLQGNFPWYRDYLFDQITQRVNTYRRHVENLICERNTSINNIENTIKYTEKTIEEAISWGKKAKLKADEIQKDLAQFTTRSIKQTENTDKEIFFDKQVFSSLQRGLTSAYFHGATELASRLHELINTKKIEYHQNAMKHFMGAISKGIALESFMKLYKGSNKEAAKWCAENQAELEKIGLEEIDLLVLFPNNNFEQYKSLESKIIGKLYQKVPFEAFFENYFPLIWHYKYNQAQSNVRACFQFWRIDIPKDLAETEKEIEVFVWEKTFKLLFSYASKVFGGIAIVACLFFIVNLALSIFSGGNENQPIKEPKVTIDKETTKSALKSKGIIVVEKIPTPIKIKESIKQEKTTVPVRKNEPIPDLIVKEEPQENISYTDLIYKDGNKVFRFENLPLFVSYKNRPTSVQLECLQESIDTLTNHYNDKLTKFSPRTVGTEFGNSTVRKLIPQNELKVIAINKLMDSLAIQVKANLGKNKIEIDIPFKDFNAADGFCRELRHYQLNYQEKSGSLDFYPSSRPREILSGLNGLTLFPAAKLNLKEALGIQNFEKISDEKLTILSKFLTVLIPSIESVSSDKERQIIKSLVSQNPGTKYENLAKIKNILVHNKGDFSIFVFALNGISPNQEISLHTNNKSSFEKLIFDLELEPSEIELAKPHKKIISATETENEIPDTNEEETIVQIKEEITSILPETLTVEKIEEPKFDNKKVKIDLIFKNGEKQFYFNDAHILTETSENGTVIDVALDRTSIAKIVEELSKSFSSKSFAFKPKAKDLELGKGKIQVLFPQPLPKKLNKEELKQAIEAKAANSSDRSAFSFEIPLFTEEGVEKFSRELKHFNLGHELENTIYNHYSPESYRELIKEGNGIIVYPRSGLDLKKLLNINNFKDLTHDKAETLSILINTLLPNGTNNLEPKAIEFLKILSNAESATNNTKLVEIEEMVLQNLSYDSPYGVFFRAENNSLKVSLATRDKGALAELQFMMQMSEVLAQPSEEMFSTGSNVTIRKEPEISQHNKLGHLRFNEKVKSFKSEKQHDGYYWNLISTSDGEKGWVRGDFLNNIKVEKRKIINPETNVREGPSVNYEIVDVPKVGTNFVITERKKKWIKIRYGKVIDKWTSISNFKKRKTRRKTAYKRKTKAKKASKRRTYTNKKIYNPVKFHTTKKRYYNPVKKESNNYQAPVSTKKKLKLKIPKNLNQLMNIAEEAAKKKY